MNKHRLTCTNRQFSSSCSITTIPSHSHSPVIHLFRYIEYFKKFDEFLQVVCNGFFTTCNM